MASETDTCNLLVPPCVSFNEVKAGESYPTATRKGRTKDRPSCQAQPVRFPPDGNG